MGLTILQLDDFRLSLIACILLFFSMIGYCLSLILPGYRFLAKANTSLILTSNLLLAFTLILRWINEGYFPLSNLYESIIFLCWCISTLHLFIERYTNSRLIGAISSPILFGLSEFASLKLPVDMQKALPLVPSLQSNWLMMHVTMMMISYATLIFGSLLCVLYIVFYQTKNKLPKQHLIQQKSKDLAIPQAKMALLQTLDLWSYRTIGLGFPFLTIGIISGAVWANEAWGTYWSWDPKETWALITWLNFAIYLHARLIKGWQGEKTAILGASGFFVIWICYLGVNFIGKGLHSYGWVL